MSRCMRIRLIDGQVNFWCFMIPRNAMCIQFEMRVFVVEPSKCSSIVAIYMCIYIHALMRAIRPRPRG